MTSVYRQLKTEDCNAKVTEHFSVHVLIDDKLTSYDFKIEKKKKKNRA